mmetsp:Transcript_38594/g.111508  ORF Transcript_38594/g.111508 Transcript_38594/m.111508 type:complete len:273 (-) Transcript_38594:9-827(-)
MMSNDFTMPLVLPSSRKIPIASVAVFNPVEIFSCRSCAFATVFIAVASPFLFPTSLYKEAAFSAAWTTSSGVDLSVSSVSCMWYTLAMACQALASPSLSEFFVARARISLAATIASLGEPFRRFAFTCRFRSCASSSLLLPPAPGISALISATRANAFSASLSAQLSSPVASNMAAWPALLPEVLNWANTSFTASLASSSLSTAMWAATRVFMTSAMPSASFDDLYLARASSAFFMACSKSPSSKHCFAAFKRSAIAAATFTRGATVWAGGA